MINLKAALAVNYTIYAGFTVIDHRNPLSDPCLPVITPIMFEMDHCNSAMK